MGSGCADFACRDALVLACGDGWADGRSVPIVAYPVHCMKSL
jgi:hypothetical protein